MRARTQLGNIPVSIFPVAVQCFNFNNIFLLKEATIHCVGDEEKTNTHEQAKVTC